jgi:hypothetical protein
VWLGLAGLIWLGALAAAIFVAKSRAGSLAMFFALVTWLSLVDASRRWLWRVAMVCVFSVALGATFLMVTHVERVPADVLPFIANKINAVIGDPRAEAVALAGDLFSKNALFGVGLGTYGSFTAGVPPHEMVWAFAHNDYAQFLAEAGLAGITGAAVVMALVGWRLRQSWATADGSERLVQAAALSGLAGLALHSGFDWNLHVPANTLIASILLGIAMAPSARGSAAGSSTLVGQVRHAARYRMALIGLAAAAGWILTVSAFEDNAAVGLRTAIAATRQRETNSVAIQDPAELRQSLSLATTIDRWRAANAPLAIAIAQGHQILAAEAKSSAARAAEELATELWIGRARRRSPRRAEVRSPKPPMADQALFPNENEESTARAF